ncbi:MAG: Hsp20/alpha crystallin family protein [Chloroflexi bacterium]|nr:Hsp20/alpha crystallin family protein [Chloroflexota bacterium]
MSSLMRWDPASEMISLRDMMDRLFEDSFVRPPFRMPIAMPTGYMPVDMVETKDEVVVKATLPGVKPEDVDLTISGNMLTVRGEIKEEMENKGENYIHRERHYGQFSRAIELPGGLQTDKADASFENGVLTLRIPKSDQVKPKSIKIKAKS